MDSRGMTHLDDESRCYPSGSLYAGRKAFVRIAANPHAPSFPQRLVGSYRVVLVGIPDTYFSIPALLRLHRTRYKGFVSVDVDKDEYTFTPEGEKKIKEITG